MSVVSYNNVTLPYPIHTQFNQEAVYDDVGQTDWYCTKFDIIVLCVIHRNFLSILAPELPNGASCAMIQDALRAKLLVPRKKLSIKCNEVELIPFALGDEVVDVQNGPKPQTCNLSQLTNESFLLTYRVVAHYWEKNTVVDGKVKNNLGANVLFNRWSEVQEIDNLDLTKLTREGKFVIRAENADAWEVDQARASMAHLAVPPGFLRESAQYTVTPDGLGLQYRIIDKEVFKRPPSPAFEAEGEFIISAPNRGSPMTFAEVRVKLKGSRSVSQARLIETAVMVAINKIRLNSSPGQRVIGGIGALTPGGPGYGTTESMSLLVEMYNNIIELRIRVLYPAITPGANWGLVSRGNFGLTHTPGSDRGWNLEGVGAQAPTPPYLLRGTAKDFNGNPILLKAAAYYDPSIGTQLNPETRQFREGVVPGTVRD